jgi:hypothetical protein
MFIISALATAFWNSFDNDYVRSTLHAIASVFLSCLSLEFNTFSVQNFNICQSLGYFIADLRYVIERRQHPSFFLHHILSIFILYIFPDRHPNSLLYSKLMLIEASNPFMNLHLVDRTCYYKWVNATFVFFLMRIVYFPIAVITSVTEHDELFYAFILYLGNLWWLYKLLLKRRCKFRQDS